MKTKWVDIKLLRQLLGYIPQHYRLLYIAGLLTLTGAVLSPLRPYLVQLTIDNYISAGDRGGLIFITLLLIGVLFIETMIQFLTTLQNNKLAQEVVHTLRQKLYSRVLQFKLTYFDKTPVGTLVTRTISDIQNIADIFSQGFLDIAGDSLKIIAIVVMMLFTHVKITLLSLITIPLLLIATNIFKHAVRRSFTAVRNQVAALNSFVQEHINGMSTVQVFNAQTKTFKKFEQLNRLHLDANNRSVWHYSVFFPVVEILSACSIGILIWWGAKEALIEKVSIGVIIAFIMYINMLFRPIRQLADRFNTLQMGIVCIERVVKLMEADEIPLAEGKLKPVRTLGKITFNQVWFAYNNEHWVLKDVSFTIAPGTRTAIIGSTGSGKTTIAMLIGRYYEVNKGEILLDDIPIQQYDLYYLRQLVGLVLQDVFLFPGSILDNVSIGRQTMDEQTLMESVNACGLAPFIQSLPGGLHYIVKERGNMLSTGQRQLVSFLRAYINNPPIMILDEATSSIDSETELLLQHATDKVTANKTSIIIAHRLSTVKSAGLILVMKNGTLCEQGTHESLMGKNGDYQKLYGDLNA